MLPPSSKSLKRGRLKINSTNNFQLPLEASTTDLNGVYMFVYIYIHMFIEAG